MDEAPTDDYKLMVVPISWQTANPHLSTPALSPERDPRPVASLDYAHLYLWWRARTCQ
jgi:hypothetical protein